MINVAEIINDPDFARRFTLRRARSLSFANEGEVSTSYGETSMIGVIQHQETTTEQTPEGTRVKKMVEVWCTEELRASDGKSIESDVLVIDREYFRITKCQPWPDNGYWQAMAESFIP